MKVKICAIIWLKVMKPDVIVSYQDKWRGQRRIIKKKIFEFIGKQTADSNADEVKTKNMVEDWANYQSS